MTSDVKEAIARIVDQIQNLIDEVEALKAQINAPDAPPEAEVPAETQQAE